MQFDVVTVQRIGFDGAIKEMDCLVILTEFKVDHCRVDIDLSGTHKFFGTYENFVCLVCIKQGVSGTIQLQAGADASDTGTRPAHFIANFQEFRAGCIEKRERFRVAIQAAQGVTTGHQSQSVKCFVACPLADCEEIAGQDEGGLGMRVPLAVRFVLEKFDGVCKCRFIKSGNVCLQNVTPILLIL